MLQLVKRLFKEEEGQGLVEYALIIALVAILLITGLGLVKGGVDKVFTDIGNKLNPPA